PTKTGGTRIPNLIVVRASSVHRRDRVASRRHRLEAYATTECREHKPKEAVKMHISVSTVETLGEGWPSRPTSSRALSDENPRL
ncbi:MAG: hypothetical protein O3B01_29535, partial [Planctomycetota bacterium]|nr:hypothetical protein [Planctomycetota bacterium]